MTRRVDPRPIIDGGLNTSVEFGGRTYHVQTQCSRRGDPVVESLVYEGGQTLIRFTASFDDGKGSRGFNADDGRHLIEHQHANLIQKIRHGLLRGNDVLDEQETESAAGNEPVRLIDSEGVVVDPAEIDDPGVCELLQELGVAIDRAVPDTPPSTHRPQPKPYPRAVRPHRPSASRPSSSFEPSSGAWWRRLAVMIRRLFR